MRSDIGLIPYLVGGDDVAVAPGQRSHERTVGGGILRRCPRVVAFPGAARPGWRIVDIDHELQSSIGDGGHGAIPDVPLVDSGRRFDGGPGDALAEHAVAKGVHFVQCPCKIAGVLVLLQINVDAQARRLQRGLVGRPSRLNAAKLPPLLGDVVGGHERHSDDADRQQDDAAQGADLARNWWHGTPYDGTHRPVR